MSVGCISCGAPAQSLGPLPDSNLFAGRARPDTLPGGELYRCPQCRLGFHGRFPALPGLLTLFVHPPELTEFAPFQKWAGRYSQRSWNLRLALLPKLWQ